MKKKMMIPISMCLLSACYFSPGERSYFWEQDGSVSISRTLLSDGGSNEEGDLQVAACIATPSTWDNPIEVVMAGTEQIEGASANYSFQATEFADGVSTISGLYALDGYDWQCFSDEIRSFVEGDTGTVEWRLSPSSNSAFVFTTVGLISSSDEQIKYYGNAVSHKLLADNTEGEYWESLELNGIEADAGKGYLSTFQTDTATYLFSSLNNNEYSFENSNLFKVTVDGIVPLADIPQTNQLLYVNNVYFSLHDYSADINGDTQGWTDVRSSTDLVNWTDADTLPNVGEILWDEINSEYVAVINDYNQPFVQAAYTSSDLNNWSEENWVSEQTPDIAFKADGAGFMSTGSTMAPLSLRDKSTGEWSVVDVLPAVDTEDQVRFQVYSVVNYAEQFHVLGLRQFYDSETVNNENILYGRSADGITWNWSSVGVYSEVGLSLSIVFISEQELFYLGDNVMRSTDGGTTWEEIDNHLNQIAVTTSDVRDNEDLSSIYKKDGRYYFVAFFGADSQDSAVIMETEDFQSYKLLTISSYAKLLPEFDDFKFLGSNTLNGQKVFHLRAAQNPENTDESDDWFGSMNYFFLLMISLLLLRKPKR
jgi:hypothetical protein